MTLFSDLLNQTPKSAITFKPPKELGACLAAHWWSSLPSQRHPPLRCNQLRPAACVPGREVGSSNHRQKWIECCHKKPTSMAFFEQKSNHEKINCSTQTVLEMKERRFCQPSASLQWLKCSENYWEVVRVEPLVCFRWDISREIFVKLRTPILCSAV